MLMPKTLSCGFNQCLCLAALRGVRGEEPGVRPGPAHRDGALQAEGG